MKTVKLIYTQHLKLIKMNQFEPTILGMTVLVISVGDINLFLQSLLLLATLIYTIIKITQSIKKNKND